MNHEIFDAANGSHKKKWVEWQHETRGLLHCGSCLSLHECWFVFGNEPIVPLHERCHCRTLAIPTAQVETRAKATSAFSKFDPYLFNTSGIHCHGKDALFKSWGYSADDALWLQEEIERQGLANYLSGNYTLGMLNMFGQRLNIRVEIPRKDGQGVVSFITGWTVLAHGKIKLNTPYGGA